MTEQDFIICITIGVSTGMGLKICAELVFYCIRQILGWFQP